MKKLIIVESPSKGTTIQKYLGSDYIVVASMGHISDLGHGGHRGIGIDLNNDFKPYYVLMKDKIYVLDNIIKESEKCDEIYIMSDMDREGESIAYHIKSYLVSTGKPIKRIEFNEITKAAIQSAVEKPRDIDMNLFHAQEARRILDRIVGFMVSPYLINNYGPNLSAGRVQSVVVRMIADREKAIEEFVPEEYWNVQTKFEFDNIQFIAKLQSNIANKEQADAVLDQIKNSQFYVAGVSSKKKKEDPPPPLTTSTLQQHMARKFGFEPERTMKAAQNLYEGGMCSYIRTDSTRISDEALDSVRKYLKEINLEAPNKPNLYTTKDTAQDAHECIRPTNVRSVPDKTILNGDDKDVYTAIWQYFVASQMTPAVFDTLNVKIAAKNSKLKFVSNGKALSSKGYIEIFGGAGLGKIDIPTLTKDDELRLVDESLKAEQKFTKPEPRFNVATIIEELDDRQIGRPATYAEVIKKITSRNYVEKTGSTYKPTELGKKITDVLIKSFHFMEYDYTANLEKQLDKIADGSLDYKKVLKDFFVPFKEKLDSAYKSSGGVICEKCNGQMIKRVNSKDETQTFLGCANWPKCKNTKSISGKE